MWRSEVRVLALSRHRVKREISVKCSTQHLSCCSQQSDTQQTGGFGTKNTAPCSRVSWSQQEPHRPSTTTARRRLCHRSDQKWAAANSTSRWTAGERGGDVGGEGGVGEVVGVGGSQHCCCITLPWASKPHMSEKEREREWERDREMGRRKEEGERWGEGERGLC